MPGSASLGIPNKFVKIYGNQEPIIAPRPISKVCIEKPNVCCSSGSLSPTNALNGSIEILMEASIIINKPPPINIGAIYPAKLGAFGIRINAVEVNIAPTRKYGRLLPKRFHVLSLICPIIG